MAKKITQGETKDVPSGRAISIQQPFIEEILRGIKKIEYRSRATHIRGRVYLYASLKVRKDGNWKRIGMEPDDLPKGLIVGSVEIVDCIYISDYEFGYKLIKPKRYKKLLKPQNRAQPCFFFPFGPIRSPRKNPKDVKKRKPYTGPVVPSQQLAAIVGEQSATRSYFYKLLMKYISKNRLWHKDKSLIIPDKKLKKITKKSPVHINDLRTFIEWHTKRR